jgi:hypothetical protein
VPAAAGLIIGGEVVKDLIKDTMGLEGTEDEEQSNII